jgi:tetratricopeptide (TPR) repeat protein
MIACSLLFASFGYAQALKEEEAFSLAKKTFSEGMYEAAITLFSRFLDNFPSSLSADEARFYLGQCYFYQKDYSSSAVQFNALLNSKSTSEFRGKIYYWIAESYFKQNDFSKAYDFYQKLTAEYPHSNYYLQSFYSLGWCLFEQGKFEEAKERFIEFKKAFTSDALAAEADLKIAQCLYRLQDYVKLKAYLGLLNKSEFGANIQQLLKFYLAESCYYTQDYSCAIEKYSDVLASASEDGIIGLVRLGLGWSYLKSNDYENAKANFDKILQNNPDEEGMENALLGKALVLQMSGKPNETLEIYDMLTSRTKNPAVRFEAYMGKAEALYNLDRCQEAIALYDEAKRSMAAEIEDATATDRLSYGLGLNYLKIKDFKRALDKFSSLADKTADVKIRIAAFSKMAETYAALGDNENAISAYRKILADYPGCESCDYAHNNLGILLSGAGRWDEVIDTFKTLIRAYPQSKVLDEAVFYLGKAYYATGDYLSGYLSLRGFKNKFPDSALKTDAAILEGACLKSLKRYAEAYEVLSQITAPANDISVSTFLTFELADCLYGLGREDEARKHLEALSSQYPDSDGSRNALWRLASHYFYKNRLDLSMQYLLDLLKSNPEASLSDDAYFMVGLCYEKEGRLLEAIDSFKKVEANKAKVYPKIADSYRVLRNFKEAIIYYRLALAEKEIDSPLIRFQLAECLEESGQTEEALELYTQLDDDRSLMVKGLLRGAKICENNGKKKEALSFYQKVVDLNVEESQFAKERMEILISG